MEVSLEYIADLLNTDVEYIIKLLQTKKLANRDIQTVYAYKTKRDKKRRKKLRDLTRASEKYGYN